MYSYLEKVECGVSCNIVALMLSSRSTFAITPPSSLPPLHRKFLWYASRASCTQLFSSTSPLLTACYNDHQNHSRLPGELQLASTTADCAHVALRLHTKLACLHTGFPLTPGLIHRSLPTRIVALHVQVQAAIAYHPLSHTELFSGVWKSPACVEAVAGWPVSG